MQSLNQSAVSQVTAGGEALAEFFAFSIQINKYSFDNALLIFLQRPDAMIFTPLHYEISWGLCKERRKKYCRLHFPRRRLSDSTFIRCRSDMWGLELPAHENNLITSDIMRLMRTPGVDIIIRDNIAVIVLYKIHGVDNAMEIELNNTIMNYVPSAKTFGFRGYFVRDAM